jgi:peptide/nickel transport system ATP-binding protein
MYAGRKLESARTKDLLTKPLHPYTKGLLACIPDINAKNPAEILCNIPGRVPDLRSPPVGCVFSPRCECAKHECSANRPKSILVEWEHETACPCFLETSKKEGLETLQSSLKTPKAENTVLLNVDNLKKSFRHETLFGSSKKIIHAVDGVTFSVMRGETFGLVGESGCGKSTLGKCIVMLLPVDGGQVVYAGRSVTALSEKLMRPFRKEMQIIFQNPDSSLNPQKRIHQIIGRPLEIFEIAEGDKKEQRIYELLDLVELPNNYYSRYPHELSGGEKQRVGIARALASEPKFIVCDEPVTSLDLSVQASILNLLKKFQNDLGISHLLISHDLSVVKHISKKIAVMYMGVFCEVGTTEQIFAPPYHPYTYCLLSSVPLIEKDNGKQRARRLRLIGVPFFRVSGKGCVFAARCPLKIGQICEEVNPPTRTCNQGHLITCHKTIEELSMLERLIW